MLRAYTCAVAVCSSLLLLGCSGDSKPAAKGPSGTKSFGSLSRDHTSERVRYPQAPPVGGNHKGVWQNCGFYASAVPNETAVHSLEHGAVWITYRPGLPSAQLDRLRALARDHGRVLVSAFEGVPTPVVPSAWSRQLRLQSADDPRLAQFVKAFEGGRQAPERGAPCSGGNGRPEVSR